MTESEIRQWQKDNGVFRCVSMNALISEVTCQQNQEQARKYVKIKHRASRWSFDAPNFDVYYHCSHCARSDIEYAPDRIRTDMGTRQWFRIPDQWCGIPEGFLIKKHEVAETLAPYVKMAADQK